MLRGPVGVSAKYYLAGTETIPLTPVPKSGPDHAVSRHIAPLRDRGMSGRSNPQVNQISEPTSSSTGNIQPPSQDTSNLATVAAVGRRAPRLRAPPAAAANLISRRSRRHSGIRRHRLGAAAPSYHSPASDSAASSIGDHNPRAEHHPARPTPHPAHPSAQPARAGVRSESSCPAERTNKKTAGIHRTGGISDRPPLPPPGNR
jgi:hypothetical protein